MLGNIKLKIYDAIRTDDENKLAGTIVDSTLIVLITLNVVVIILETFQDIPENVHDFFHAIDTVTAILFSIEYILRVWTADYIYPELSPALARLRYMVSFMALIDLFAVLPFYLPMITKFDLRILRSVRLLRLLRIFKITRYTDALTTVGLVLKKRAPQFISSMFVVFILMVIASVLMYNIESQVQPEVFENAFSGLWWSVGTLTTIGYGDIYPITTAGKVLSILISILGIGLIAVPTGIISAGFIEQMNEGEKQKCPHCGRIIEQDEKRN